MRSFVHVCLTSTLICTSATLMGCTETDGEPISPAEELLPPPPSGQGIQYRMVTSIEPGSEVEHCLFVKAPAEGMLVQRDLVRYTATSHHVLVYETKYDEIPTQKNDGTKVDTSSVFDCSDGPSNGWSVTKVIGGSQNANGTSSLNFPQGVAVRVRPGAVLMVNGHFLNPSSEKSTPEVRVNLYTIPESELKEEGDILFLYNPFIHVGANGKSRARMRCPVHKDITLVNAQSHMHARGIGYEASVVGDAQPFYTHTHWESVPIKEFGDGLHIKAGSFLDYHCDYNNAATRDIFQGPSAKDEMCMLVGSYYPANEATTNCLEDPLLPIDQNSMGGEWVGNGTTSCANTLGCIQSAQDFNILQSCIVASDPAVSKEMSAAVRCIFKSANPLASCQTEFSQCLAK